MVLGNADSSIADFGLRIADYGNERLSSCWEKHSPFSKLARCSKQTTKRKRLTLFNPQSEIRNPQLKNPQPVSVLEINHV
jgi:hypothetical protein